MSLVVPALFLLFYYSGALSALPVHEQAIVQRVQMLLWPSSYMLMAIQENSSATDIAFVFGASAIVEVVFYQLIAAWFYVASLHRWFWLPISLVGYVYWWAWSRMY